MSYDTHALALMALLGLMIGSFLNVLIHRLPIMIEQSWTDSVAPESRGFNLAFPASHCPLCEHPIAWYDNLPVVSFMLLRGRCRHCKTPIAWQYPLVELGTAVLFAWSAHAHSNWGSALAWSFFSCTLLALAVIDARTTWLPDALTQPLTWGGLLAATLGWSGLPLADALWGAVAGYLCLWSVYWVFLLVTGKEGMGHGDFKLLAALGAWLGWQQLLAVVLIASISSLVFALVLLLRRKMPDNRQIPFGPYLALAGGWLMFFGAPALLRL
jgi:leader peptidase (prepilin peptidase)/N-methyltransferase